MTTLPASVRERTVLAAPVAVSPQRGGPVPGITAQDILGIIRRRIAMILSIWVLGIGLTAAGTYVWMTNWPSYRASALINVESTTIDKPYGEMWELPTFVKDQVERAMRDQTMQIKSLGVLQDTIEDVRVRDTFWWQSQVRQEPTEAMLWLQDRLAASPIRDSNIIAVSFDTRKIDDAPIIVNAVVQHYFERLNNALKSRFGKELTQLENEVRVAETQLRNKINEITQYQVTEAAIPGILNQMTVVSDNLMRLGAMRTEAKARMAALTAQYEAYQKSGIEQIPLTPEIMIAVESDPHITNLEVRRTQLIEAKQSLMEKFGEQHRSVIDLDNRVRTVDQEAQSRRLEKLAQYRHMQMERVRLDMLSAVDQVNQIDQEYREAEGAQTDMDRKRAHLDNLMEEKKRAEERLDSGRKKLYDLNYVINRPDKVRITPLQDATRPLERSSPSWKINMPAGTILSLLLGAGLALLLEFMNTSVRTPQDIVRYAAMPVLGIVPELDDEEVRIDNIELATRLAPRSMVAECFRRTRTNLLFCCPPDRQRTVLITSTRPEEGKTAVAINLAVASAQAGRKILLVDCNFRRPALNRAFPQIRKEGLANLLVGQCELKDLINRTDIPTFDVLGAGPSVPNPAELLGSSYFKAFLAEAAGMYDQVFLDGPPALLVSDALVAAATVDGVIIVSHAGATSRGALRRLRDTLDRVGVHVLGVVLNAAETQAGGYFKEMYRSYYDYDESANQVLPGLPSGNGDIHKKA
jgi:capsular exopolysaccharide synthesis family protein